VSETREDRQRDRLRKQAAEDYDDFDKRVEKHWSEKKREEMTERDWRIFREDFNISYKGNTGGTLPMRNWEEAGLPDVLMRVRTLSACRVLLLLVLDSFHGLLPCPGKDWKAAVRWVRMRAQAIKKMGYEKPSPIQMAAIPLGLQFRDVIGVAETGSGKTAAFVFPMLVYIMKQPKMTEEIASEGPYAVVMAPTRELAQQIEVRSTSDVPYACR
jgi:ATP-dependent RNA helicase DDX23/PRP28